MKVNYFGHISALCKHEIYFMGFSNTGNQDIKKEWAIKRWEI